MMATDKERWERVAAEHGPSGEVLAMDDRSRMRQEAMDGSPGVSVFWRTNGTGAKSGPYGEVKWQLGPVQESGVNGTTIEDVLEVCAARLRGFQAAPFACRENALAITAIEEAINWLLMRTRKRQEQGVEGTNQSHI